MSRIVSITSGEKKVKCGIGYLSYQEYEVSIKWSIYKHENKFLWKKWYTYSYKISAPYINIKYDLQSVRERNTNIMIEQEVVSLRHEIEDKILKMKMDDKIVK